jgi:sRNA-binding regulator protein Hfq
MTAGHTVQDMHISMPEDEVFHTHRHHMVLKHAILHILSEGFSLKSEPKAVENFWIVVVSFVMSV